MDTYSFGYITFVLNDYNYSFHYIVTLPQEDSRDLKYVGLDLLKGQLRNNLDAGVVEPAISKIKSLRFATEAAITILRIDDLIKLEKQEASDPRGRH